VVTGSEISREQSRNCRETEVAGIKSLTLRQARLSDLQTVNQLIDSAIATWDLADRVKRLAAPLCHYDAHDFDCLELMVAEAESTRLVGVAAWEQADPGDAPGGQHALLLHGIYVAPDLHRNGVGTRLLNAAEEAALSRGFDGLLVKVQPGAEKFFYACGLEPVAVENDSRDYPHRYWKPLKPV